MITVDVKLRCDVVTCCKETTITAPVLPGLGSGFDWVLRLESLQPNGWIVSRVNLASRVLCPHCIREGRSIL